MNLRVRDVAAQLNISEKTVYKWLGSGLIPAARIGKTWIITEESIQSILAPRTLLFRNLLTGNDTWRDTGT